MLGGTVVYIIESAWKIKENWIPSTDKEKLENNEKTSSPTCFFYCKSFQQHFPNYILLHTEKMYILKLPKKV